MKLCHALCSAVLALGTAVVPFAVPEAAAADPPENDLAVVANQNASTSCSVGWTTAYDNRVLLANPVTGAFVQDLGVPTGIVGKLNEAKPFSDNNKIVALWGPSGGGRGGVGVYDRKLSKWATSFPLPADFGGGDGLAHSVAWLPGDKFAVAQTGTIGTSPQWGYVVLFDSAGAQVQPPIPMTGAHGVEWDGAGHVYAVGDNHVVKYAYDNGVLAERDTWQLPLGPDGKRGGHDLRRRRTDAKYSVTTNGASWLFDPAITDDAAAFTEVRRTSTTPLGGVKSMDQRFDGRTVYSFIPTPKFFFLNPAGESNAQFCAKPYKVRWLYGMDQPMYREDVASDAPAGAAREPFLWERNKVVRGDTLKVSGQIWAGEGAGDYTAGSAVNKINNAFTNDPALDAVYVKFYHWGDSGRPNIYNAHNATTTDLNQWRDYADAMAKAIGTRLAYVVIEPEWDANPKVCSHQGYRRALRDVIGRFRTYAPNTTLINSVGLWKGDSVYQCFASTDTATYPDTASLHKKFDAHGLLTHLVSNASHCTLRDPNHFLYPTEPRYTGGKTLQGARDYVAALDDTTAQYGFPRLRRLFATSTVYLTDVAITDCNWGDSGQTTLLNDIGGRLVELYEQQGLRGVAFRSGGPGKAECYLGVENERGVDNTTRGGFRYSDNPSFVSALKTALTTMEGYVNSGQQPADPPKFTSKAVGPARAAAGSPVPFEVTVTNIGGTLTDGIVDFEIVAPSGQRADNGQKFWPDQDIASGSTATYRWTWPGMTTTGTYRLEVGVFSAGWATEHHWNETAGTLVLDATGEPAFTSSASATPSVVAPDGTTTINASITNTGGALTGGTVTIYVTSPEAKPVTSWQYTGQDVAAGASRSYTATFTAPSTGGEYDVGVSVAAAGGTPEYHENPAAGSVTVATSKFTSSASATRVVVKPDGSTTVTATVSNTGSVALVNGIVDLYVYDNTTTESVRRQYWTGQSIAVGTTATYSWPVTMPSTEGNYTVKIGVFTSDWRVQHWNNAALPLVVDAPRFTVTAMTTPSTMQAGGPVTIVTTVTNVGGHVDGGVVDVEVYNAAGALVTGGKKFWSGQSLGHGETKTYDWPWTAPSTLGTYTVKVGVFGTSGTTWTPRYAWIDRADTFVVADPKFTSSADVSQSTVSPGATVTITATFDNVGGSMTNGITDLEVWTPSGTKDKQQFHSGQSIEHGRSAQYTLTWTAPSTPGTYTVKLGVFTSTWGTQWHWKDAAATISVGGATFQPSFRVGDGANTWWIELYTSSDVTGVDAIGDNGRFYLTLTKRSWGAWAATAPSELASGQPIQFVARRSSDGATAASSQFGWLTGSPVTSPGWACTFTLGAFVSTTWVEIVVSSTATAVDVKAGTGAWTALTYSSASGKWGRAMNVAAGTKVVFRAKRADNATAYSRVYTWLQ